MSEKVKLGIIGIGNQGSTYARRLARENWVPDIQLVAIADINPDRIAWARENGPDRLGQGKRVGGHRLF